MLHIKCLSNILKDLNNGLLNYLLVIKEQMF